MIKCKTQKNKWFSNFSLLVSNARIELEKIRTVLWFMRLSKIIIIIQVRETKNLVLKLNQIKKKIIEMP